MSNTPAILIEKLYKSYGKVQALDGLDLTAQEGSVLAVLGPNGAGKTTAVRCLTTLTKPDSGHVEVAGYDVVRQAGAVRACIGLTGQFAAVDERLTGFENLEMFGQLYHLSAKTARKRAGELLERFDLLEAAGRFVKTYSGGMRRRLDLAASLIANPPILFLDEPTTGLDPRARLAVWEIIRDLIADGKTVFLTTQYLDEADLLAHQIAVVDLGRVIAKGTSDELKEQFGGERLEVSVAPESDLQLALQTLQPYAVAGEVQLDDEHRHLTAPLLQGGQKLAAIIRDFEAAQVVLEEFALRRPTLDDVFLSLTGRAATRPNGNGAHKPERISR
jgi:ABC-2 type transport system ATP-binding protein